MSPGRFRGGRGSGERWSRECVHLTAGHVICTCYLGEGKPMEGSILTLAVMDFNYGIKMRTFICKRTNKKVNGGLSTVWFSSLSPRSVSGCKYRPCSSGSQRLPGSMYPASEHLGLMGTRATFAFFYFRPFLFQLLEGKPGSQRRFFSPIFLLILSVGEESDCN